MACPLTAATTGTRSEYTVAKHELMLEISLAVYGNPPSSNR